MLALVLACTLFGCGGETAPVLVLRDFTLVAPDQPTREIRIPIHVDGVLPKARSRFTLTTQVSLPPTFRGRPLTLAIPFWQSRARLRVNGLYARSEDDVEQSYRGLGPTRWILPPSEAEVLSLDLEVESTWTQSAWLDSPPRLSPTAGGDASFLAWRTFHQATTLAALVTILLVAVSYAIIFFSARERTAAGWFALEAFVGAGYPAFYLGILPRVLGTADVSIVADMLAIAGVANVHFVHAHCKLPRPTRAWWAAVAVVIVVGFVFRSPFESTRWSGTLTVLLMVANAAHETRIFVRLVRRGARLHEWIVPLSWPLACVFAAGDFAGWVGFGGVNDGMARAASLGIGIVSVMQSVGLSREYILALHHADALNLELSARVQALQSTNDEVKNLNEELRRHIAQRSQSLVEALGRDSPGAVAAHDVLRPGVIVSDRYRVVRALGEGGMGAVFEVERARDGRHFALKAIANAAGSAATVRLAREAEIVSHIDHPNVVRVIDVDVTAAGLVYVVLELVSGQSLDGHARSWGDVPWAEQVLAQIARGLEAIHKRGIVHRDLKPSNVLVEAATGVVKIADFGISTLGLGQRETAAALRSAAIADDATTSSFKTPQRPDITATGVVLGTPLYMAPELIRGARDAQPAVDVFSFGIIACELLTGKHPFGEAPITRAMRGERTVPGLAAPTRVESTIRRCLDFDPELRPTAADLVRAFPTNARTIT